METKHKYWFFDENDDLLKTVRATDLEDAWRQFARATTLYTERPRYPNEDIGEELAAAVSALKDGGIQVLTNAEV